MLKSKDFKIQTLGQPAFTNPLIENNRIHQESIREDFIPYSIQDSDPEHEKKIKIELASPRRKLFFSPKKTTAALVTCGGLCPGLNDVIRAVFHELYYHYKISRILGIPYGYSGLNPESGHPLYPLTKERVRTINQQGGTILGSSRGEQDLQIMVDTLVANDVNILFCMGGDGTLNGAHAIAQTIKKRSLNIAVIGIPKTIDNDIVLCHKSFGFDTAVEKATEALAAVNVEANGAHNGVGLVKLMGRDSGFIGAHATLADGNVNFLLVPEMRFSLKGKYGLLPALMKRIQARGHAVICVSEGAGQHLLAKKSGADASGNRKYGDIGLFLKDEIKDFFTKEGVPMTLKYIDPSYMIRSAPANTADSIFCGNLGRCAVHAAMAGKTDCMIGVWHGRFTYVPLNLVVGHRKTISLKSDLWRNILETTGQFELVQPIVAS